MSSFVSDALWRPEITLVDSLSESWPKFKPRLYKDLKRLNTSLINEQISKDILQNLYSNFYFQNIQVILTFFCSLIRVVLKKFITKVFWVQNNYPSRDFRTKLVLEVVKDFKDDKVLVVT